MASLILLSLACLLLASCTAAPPTSKKSKTEEKSSPEAQSPTEVLPPKGKFTLAFAGDTMAEGDLGPLATDASAWTSVQQTLGQADYSMLNLEAAVTTADTKAAKELEASDNRYHFKVPPAMLSTLGDAGVDVVTVANNHGADFGAKGLAQTLQAKKNSPIGVVGVGKNIYEAYQPHSVKIKNTKVAFFGADASFLESKASVWQATPTNPGLASARTPYLRQFLKTVSKATFTHDVVVVYMHWGEEGAGCPTEEQKMLAQKISRAGASIIVGSHAHQLQGAGWLNNTYVAYGLGNYVWYHGRSKETGVLTVTVDEGRVKNSSFAPAEIPEAGGLPRPAVNTEQALNKWRALQNCTGLDPYKNNKKPKSKQLQEAAKFSSSAVTPALRTRAASSHGNACPVSWDNLRYVKIPYFNFKGQSRLGELMLHKDEVQSARRIFAKLYEQKFPLASMQMVSDFASNDELSMEANNSSGFNCRRVKGTDTYSSHAYGKAIDLNPIQNPYIIGEQVLPSQGKQFSSVNRTTGNLPAGVIGNNSPVVKAFAAEGWEWGGNYASPDYQHFYKD